MVNDIEDAMAKALSKIKPSLQLQAEIDRMDAEKQRIQISHALEACGAPSRHLMAKVKTDGEWGKKLEKFMKATPGYLASLIGTRGCGKTQIAVELMRNEIEIGFTALYCTATEFFVEIKSTYRPDSKLTEKDVLETFSKPTLLVIDEFGQRGETPWENRLLFELINRRYNNLASTLLISNQTPDAFMASIGPSLASRMKETGGIIHCDWESFR